MGNVSGVGAVEDATAGGVTEPEFHTVEKGDTLWAIATKTMATVPKSTQFLRSTFPC
ncbi:MAG: LysM peptidoglycan-binding domain-containing protein [Aliishimia sp.]